MLGSWVALITLASFLKPPRAGRWQPAAARASSTNVRLSADLAAADAASEQQEPVGAAVGIDLGTTSSSIAVVRDGIAEVVLSSDGRKTMPSRVRYGPDGSAPLVGEAAGDLALGSAKRLIGRTYEEVTAAPRARALFGEQLVALPCGGAGLRCPGSGTVCSPEDVAALVDRPLARARAPAPGHLALVLVPLGAVPLYVLRLLRPLRRRSRPPAAQGVDAGEQT